MKAGRTAVTTLWVIAHGLLQSAAQQQGGAARDATAGRAKPQSALRSPFWEPSLGAHYPPLANFSALDGPFASIPRFRDLSPETLSTLIADGQPFVVEDCGEQAKLKEWQCRDYGQKFPAGLMKAEYSYIQTPEGAQASESWITLSQKGWHTEIRHGIGHKEHLSGGQKIASPYVWHVKDHEPRTSCTSTKSCWPVKHGMQREWSTPYFLRDKKINSHEAIDSFEMWFNIRGGGAFAHADAYNEMTLSLQLRGNKTWRIGMHPPIHSAFHSFSSTDGGIYKAKRWAPEYTFSVGPGECFVFPPGYFHETLVKEEDNSNDYCTVAATFQFNAPLPARYWRQFLPRWMHSHLGWGEKGDVLWGNIAQFGMWMNPSLNLKTIKRRAEVSLNHLDFNSDGEVRLEEIHQFLLDERRGEWATRKQFAWMYFVPTKQRPAFHKQVSDELADVNAKGLIDYHDSNRDGTISYIEIVESLWQWNVLMSRKNELHALFMEGGTAEELLQVEIRYLRKYACAGEPVAEEACQHMKDLLKRGADGGHKGPIGRLSIFNHGDGNDGEEEDEEGHEDHFESWLEHADIDLEKAPGKRAREDL